MARAHRGDSPDIRGLQMTGLTPNSRDEPQQSLTQQRPNISAQSYQMLYEATPAMLHSIDQQGRLMHVSDAWLTTLNYARDEVVGRLVVDFFTPASRAYATTTGIPELFRDGWCKDIAYQMVRRNGTVMDVLLSAVIQRDTSLSLTVSVDVTERKRAQSELVAQHERLRVTLHSIGEGVITTDARGYVEYLNPVAEKLTGWSNGAARGLPSGMVLQFVDETTRL